MIYDVFLSHSSLDKVAADAICATLEGDGMRCWIAPRNILPGAQWATSILNGIASSRLMVLVFSANAQASKHIRREVERGVHHGIPIVPVRIDTMLPADDLEYFLSSSHWTDIRPLQEQSLRNLSEQVQALLRISTPPGGEECPAPAIQTAPAKQAAAKPATVKQATANPAPANPATANPAPARPATVNPAPANRSAAGSVSSRAKPAGAPLPRIEAPAAPPASALSPELLTRVEGNLMTILGPVARHLVATASRQAANPEDLCRALLPSIPSAMEQAAFLKKCGVSLQPGPTGPSSPSGQDAQGRPPTGNWDPAVLERIRKELAVFIGPMARVVVSQAAAKARNTDELAELLVAEVHSPKDQRKFRQVISTIA